VSGAPLVGVLAAGSALAACAGVASAGRLPPLLSADPTAERSRRRATRHDRRARSKALHADVPQLLDLLAAGAGQHVQVFDGRSSQGNETVEFIHASNHVDHVLTSQSIFRKEIPQPT